MAKFKDLKHLHESHSVNDDFRGLDNSGICKSVDKKRLYNAVSSLEDKTFEVNFGKVVSILKRKITIYFEFSFDIKK